jgi:ATP-binding cassette, subfamily F, member 3
MLVIDDLSVRVAGRTLIDGASARIPAGARVGLIGRNGAGKTTLFRVIAGDLAPEHGRVSLPRRWRIGRLAQEAPDGPAPLIDVVLAADGERTALLAQAESAQDAHAIAEIQTRLADIGAHAAPARAAAILAGLGFAHAELARPCAEFSGGWRMRVALAAVLFAQPDLLLLDEPTNYLDLEGTLWLQEHLARYPHTLIVVSHDRDLLDGAVGHILSLEQRKLMLYRGGYSAFARQRAERLMLDQKLIKKQAAQRKHLQAFVDRFRAKATKARQAQSRLKMLAKLEPIAALVTEEVRPIHLPAPEKQLSPPIVACEGVAVGYDGRAVLAKLNLRIDDDDRIALIGANGNGKSTFVKLIAGKLKPLAGKITRAANLKVGYFAQHQLDELDGEASPYDHVRRLLPEAPEAKVRARVGAIGFSGEAADHAAKTLSGGEKARLLLGLATFAAPHLVILDEPTNHLDIDSRAALIEAINDYPGAVILVSHDRHLLEACADRLWLVADGRVTPFAGDLDDYRRAVLAERGGGSETKTSNAPSRSDLRRAAAEKRAQTAPLRQRVKQAEARIEKLTRELAALDRKLTDGNVFARDAGEAAALAKARAETAATLAAAEEEWLAASSALETA